MTKEAWVVIKGNTSQQEIPIKNKKGELVDDLASASSIRFQVKEEREGSAPALISKSLENGIEVDQPSLGFLTITLLPSDTSIRPSDLYVMALQIEWEGDDKYEIKLKINGNETDRFIVKAGVIL